MMKCCLDYSLHYIQQRSRTFTYCFQPLQHPFLHSSLQSILLPTFKINASSIFLPILLKCSLLPLFLDLLLISKVNSFIYHLEGISLYPQIFILHYSRSV